MSNHLGNVMATISDNYDDVPDPDNPGRLFKVPVVLSARDYHPFGMEMPGRTYSVNSEYRFGFNGKEADKNGEWGGLTHYDYGFRIYNPAVGRFLSVDPIFKEYESPYLAMANNPIHILDPSGLDTVIMHAQKVSSPEEWGDVYIFKITFSVIKNGVETGIDVPTDDGVKEQVYLVGRANYFESAGNRWYDVGSSETDEGTRDEREIRFENYTSGSGRTYDNSIRLSYIGTSPRRILAHYGKNSSWGAGCQIPGCELEYSTYGQIDVVGSQEVLDGIRELYDQHIPSSQTVDNHGRTVQSPDEGYNFLLRTHSEAPKSEAAKQKEWNKQKAEQRKSEMLGPG